MNHSDGITVCISRTAKPGREAEFERALQDFVQRSLALPGQLGVHIMRPAPGGSSREYGIIRKFAHREALESFHKSPVYEEWTRIVPELTEGEPRFEELTGLESWFTLPGAKLVPLPKWKMAVVTLLGVYPTSLLLGVTIGHWTRDWHFLLGALAFAGSMVFLLTWVVMPMLTRMVHRWLHPSERKSIHERNRRSEPDPAQRPHHHS